MKGKENEIYYPIMTDYGYGIDPVYSKDLVRLLDRDSIVMGFRVNEWKK